MSAVEIRLAALQLALRDGVASFDIVILRVWIAYLVARGWVLAWVAYPAGYRALRAEASHAPGTLLALYERDARLDSFGIDAASRYQRSVMRLATAERRPPAEVLGDLLTLQALSFSGAAEEAAEAPASAPTALLPTAAPAAANDGPRATRKLSLGEFMRLHPRLLPVLARLARDAIRSLGARVSINALFERLRMDLDLYREACGGTLPPAGRNGATWRLDNSHRAAVGRLLVASEPDLASHLDLRRSRADRDPLVVARVAAATARARRAS